MAAHNEASSEGIIISLSDPQPNETLALVSFRPEERFLRPDGLNIFACHTDKQNVLAQKMRPL